MNYVLANEDALFNIDFKVNGAFVVPSEGRFFVTVRDSLGQKVFNSEIIMSTPKDQFSLRIESKYNTKLPEEVFAEYDIETVFNLEGQNHKVKTTYRVIDYIPYSADINSVRQYYGLGESELDEESFDLQEVVLSLVLELGTRFTDALKSNSLGKIRANRLITLVASEQLWTSLQLRAVESEGDSTAKYSRSISRINWESKLKYLQDEIFELKSDLSGVNPVAEVDYSPVALGNVTDPITGV